AATGRHEGVQGRARARPAGGGTDGAGARGGYLLVRARRAPGRRRRLRARRALRVEEDRSKRRARLSRLRDAHSSSVARRDSVRGRDAGSGVEEKILQLTWLGARVVNLERDRVRPGGTDVYQAPSPK